MLEVFQQLQMNHLLQWSSFKECYVATVQLKKKKSYSEKEFNYYLMFVYGMFGVYNVDTVFKGFKSDYCYLLYNPLHQK